MLRIIKRGFADPIRKTKDRLNGRCTAVLGTLWGFEGNMKR